MNIPILTAYLRWMVALNDTAFRRAMLDLCLPQPGATLLDVGCHDGTTTKRVAEKIGAGAVFGLEGDPTVRTIAQAKGIRVVACDLNSYFPFRSGWADVVFCEQVFEHLPRFETLLQECHRVLRPGGCLVLSTVNLASWANVISLLFGWQPVSYAQLTPRKAVVGNPVAFRDPKEVGSQFHCHIVPITLPAMKELAELHGFTVEESRGAGYPPFPPPLSVWASRVNPAHASSINLRLRKPPR